jgi:hypothetical protein
VWVRLLFWKVIRAETVAQNPHFALKRWRIRAETVAALLISSCMFPVVLPCSWPAAICGQIANRRPDEFATLTTRFGKSKSEKRKAKSKSVF